MKHAEFKQKQCGKLTEEQETLKKRLK